jgi:hypothetical protein
MQQFKDLQQAELGQDAKGNQTGFAISCTVGC